MVYVGFFSGLLYDLTTTGPVGLMSLLLALVGYGVALMSRGLTSGVGMETLRVVIAAILGVNLIYSIAMLGLGVESRRAFVAIGVHGLASTVLDVLASIPFLLMAGSPAAQRGVLLARFWLRRGSRFKGLEVGRADGCPAHRYHSRRHSARRHHWLAAVPQGVLRVKFTFDTQNGTRPRASEGRRFHPGRQVQRALQAPHRRVGAVFAAIIAKLWSMQMVSSDHYDALAEKNQTRTVTTPAPRGRHSDRNGVAIVDNRPSLCHHGVPRPCG